MSTNNTEPDPETSDTDTTETDAETTDYPYEEICGAANRNGNPCKRPAGWGTPGSGGKRCKFHGGSSTGPKDTSYLEGNDHAEGNPGGRPPDGNSNASLHGGFSDWETAYQRFKSNPDGEAWSRIQEFKRMYLETATKTAPTVDPEEREQLIRELATRRVLKQQAQSDVWNDASGRGLVFEDDSGRIKANPAHKAGHQQKQRTLEIVELLSLWE